MSKLLKYLVIEILFLFKRKLPTYFERLNFVLCLQFGGGGHIIVKILLQTSGNLKGRTKFLKKLAFWTGKFGGKGIL